MQARVDEIRGDVEQLGPFARGIRDHQPDTVLFQ
jgi:hypothetical protein